MHFDLSYGPSVLFHSLQTNDGFDFLDSGNTIRLITTSRSMQANVITVVYDGKTLNSGLTASASNVSRSVPQQQQLQHKATRDVG
jgi:hypothetical protein